jgi:hypothetical protein
LVRIANALASQSLLEDFHSLCIKIEDELGLPIQPVEVLCNAAGSTEPLVASARLSPSSKLRRLVLCDAPSSRRNSAFSFSGAFSDWMEPRTLVADQHANDPCLVLVRPDGHVAGAWNEAAKSSKESNNSTNETRTLASQVMAACLTSIRAD